MLRAHPVDPSQLTQRNIPLLVFSAGLGDLIDLYLKRKLHAIPPNTHVISNFMQFSSAPDPVLTGFSEPLIHMFNKDASHIAGTAFEAEVKGRANAILLGDSLGDVNMADGYDLETVIKVGFLNAGEDELLEEYTARYDVVVLGDGDMECVHAMVLELAGAVAPGKTPDPETDFAFARSPHHVL